MNLGNSAKQTWGAQMESTPIPGFCLLRLGLDLRPSRVFLFNVYTNQSLFFFKPFSGFLPLSSSFFQCLIGQPPGHTRLFPVFLSLCFPLPGIAPSRLLPAFPLLPPPPHRLVSEASELHLHLSRYLPDNKQTNKQKLTVKEIKESHLSQLLLVFSLAL